MPDIQEVLSGPFDIETHRRTFCHYLEVCIDPEGVAHYANPSHQRWLLERFIIIHHSIPSTINSFIHSFIIHPSIHHPGGAGLRRRPRGLAIRARRGPDGLAVRGDRLRGGVGAWHPGDPQRGPAFDPPGAQARRPLSRPVLNASHLGSTRHPTCYSGPSST